MSDVVIVDYGAGNTRSVRAAITHVGRSSEVSADPARIVAAPYVVLPGVGSARSAMVHLNETGAADALRERYRSGGSTLGICLGMQLALASSEEDGGVACLGLLEGKVVRLVADRVPVWAGRSWNRGVTPTTSPTVSSPTRPTRSPPQTVSPSRCSAARFSACSSIPRRAATPVSTF